MQKGAFPSFGLIIISYETAALDKTALSTLSDRWAVSCIEFIVKIRPGALSIYEKNPEISVGAKVEFPIGKKLFHLSIWS